MNILFLTLLDFDSLEERNIYTDLLREFKIKGHSVYVISPAERRKKQNTKVLRTDISTILKLKIGNIQKTNIIEKGISTVCIEWMYIAGIKKYFGNVKFDLVLYSTPPITFCKAIEFVKKRDNARTYLLLKDIFPQNAVDMGMLEKTGIKSFLYKYFRNKEKRLYAISDYIGCMSQANVDYIVKHNPEVNPNIVEVCPNSVEPVDMSIGKRERNIIREKYNIPMEKKAFIYGGNIGKPQGIDFLIKCIESQKGNDDIFFIIVGDGTEYGKIDTYASNSRQSNLMVMKRIPKEDYDTLVAACDVGMIFLDYRFTIPNFPSRILSYMQAKIPVLVVTDPNTDIGKVVVEGGFGWWCKSGETDAFCETISIIQNSMLGDMNDRAFEFLEKNYSSKVAFECIMKHM